MERDHVQCGFSLRVPPADEKPDAPARLATGDKYGTLYAKYARPWCANCHISIIGFVPAPLNAKQKPRTTREGPGPVRPRAGAITRRVALAGASGKRSGANLCGVL
jgi:hypothetical protein